LSREDLNFARLARVLLFPLGLWITRRFGVRHRVSTHLPHKRKAAQLRGFFVVFHFMRANALFNLLGAPW
jgi:hypothetical protein